MSQHAAGYGEVTILGIICAGGCVRPMGSVVRRHSHLNGDPG